MSATGETSPQITPYLRPEMPDLNIVQVGMSGFAFFRASGQAGTTLIETLVVVTITALVAMIGVPQMRQSLLTLSQQQAVAVVSARLRLAQAEALRGDAPIVFGVAGDGRSYGVLGRVTTPTPPGVTVSIARQPDGRIGRIIFYGDGSASGGVVAVSAGRRTLRVVVTPGVGAVAARAA